jgi:hypothetical protein
MKEKWLPVGVLAGILFAINVAGRVVATVWGDGKDDREIKIGFVALGLIGLVTLIAAMRWTLRYPVPRVWTDLGTAVLAGCLASVLIGPFLVGDRPFDEGAGLFFRQIWWYLAVTLGCGLFGALVVMMLGKDYKSQAWKRYAEQARSRPHKVVRR